MNISNWFTGVVEDINDPLQMGRVRVRCFNYHTPDKADLPTEDLPWSTCVLPVTSACINGIGETPIGLLPGSWVFGFFRDGVELQDAVVIGSIPSFSTPANRNEGFADPHGAFPSEFGSDIPAGATTYGYGNNESYLGSLAEVGNFNTVATGRASQATTLQGAPILVEVSGDIGKLISIARGEIGIRETSKNQGPGIAKYWPTTSYPQGYNNREPWCAAFMCWCIKQAGLFSEEHRPKSAAAYKLGGFEAWARGVYPSAVLTMRPSSIKTGDIVIFSFSHIGIATSDSDSNGSFRTIEGNTNAQGSRDGNGVWEKTRNIASLRSSIRIATK